MMPGVPSGRGCDACRQSKKKCDQREPSCSRCTRLQIACIGSGQRRYKFKTPCVAAPPARPRLHQQVLPNPGRPGRAPSNHMTKLASAFVATLEVTDLRYDMACYGRFLRHIPKRLGTNKALDASVNAMVTAYSSLHIRGKPPETFASYVHALRTLRFCLHDAACAQSPDTLCAIYLIMVCQGWIGNRDDQDVGHGVVMAHLLNAAASKNWTESFESEMVITLCIPVILESIGNPKIQLDPWLLKLDEMYCASNRIGCIGGDSFQSLSLRNLAKFTDFVRSPELHFSEIQPTYQAMLAEMPTLRQRLAEMAEIIPPSSSRLSPPSIATLRQYSRYQVTYGLVLTFSMVLNYILRAFYPSNSLLAAESASFADEILTLAVRASPYRPLTSSYIPLCLMAAWAGADEKSKRSEVEEMMAEYQSDFAEGGWMEAARWLRKQFETPRLKLTISQFDATVGMQGAVNGSQSRSKRRGRGLPINYSCLR